MDSRRAVVNAVSLGLTRSWKDLSRGSFVTGQQLVLTFGKLIIFLTAMHFGIRLRHLWGVLDCYFQHVLTSFLRKLSRTR